MRQSLKQMNMNACMLLLPGSVPEAMHLANLAAAKTISLYETTSTDKPVRIRLPRS
ncbi:MULTISPECIES: hypothetical protein [unclassified Paenibacillus]|uniref:Uncharacterized protein n=1 Tax=Paenibacillus provencensis TaxID=441151 RepID=A0ABW3Q380_9BACL|nr:MULTISPECIES: hypothetical protein [unclassified Paenibacillus]